jgi:hypothetical protein
MGESLTSHLTRTQPWRQLTGLVGHVSVPGGSVVGMIRSRGAILRACFCSTTSF